MGIDYRCHGLWAMGWEMGLASLRNGGGTWSCRMKLRFEIDRENEERLADKMVVIQFFAIVS